MMLNVCEVVMIEEGIFMNLCSTIINQMVISLPLPKRTFSRSDFSITILLKCYVTIAQYLFTSSSRLIIFCQ